MFAGLQMQLHRHHVRAGTKVSINCAAGFGVSLPIAAGYIRMAAISYRLQKLEYTNIGMQLWPILMLCCKGHEIQILPSSICYALLHLIFQSLQASLHVTQSNQH